MANVSKRIPANTQPTWQADINGKRYEYASGKTVSVPEEVAALIDDAEAGMAKEDPRASQRGIEKEVTQIVKDNFTGGVGYEETSETVMLPETSFECVTVPSDIAISDSFPYTFESGQDYTVTLDGETQTCTVVETPIGWALTNTSLDDAMSGSGWLIMAGDGGVRLQTLDSSLLGTHTIKIGYPTTITHKVDSKYLTAAAPLIIYAKAIS